MLTWRIVSSAKTFFGENMTHGVPLFLTNSLGGGGAERSTNIVINELLHLSFHVELSIFDSSVPDLVFPKCKVTKFESRFNNRVTKLLDQFLQFNKYLHTNRPSVIVANCALPELMASLMFYRVPIIVVEHASQPWPRYRILGIIVRRFLQLRGARWVKVSKHLKIWGLPKVVPIEIKNPTLHESHIEKNEAREGIKRLVFIGRFSPEKNPKFFLEIASLSNLPALMIGDGKLLDSLRNYARLKAIQVDFAGHVKNPWSLVTNGDLLIVPSKNEGDGLVVVEALVHQRPFLLNACPDLLRFAFPSRHYCSTVTDYVGKIESQRDNLQFFAVPNSISQEILEQRDPKIVALKWLEFLVSVSSVK
jgi:glycosyltransferase involved in cell wall biosynthesis